MSSYLRGVHDLSVASRSLYRSFKYFNVVQSDCFDVAYRSDKNLVVASPTGSGKTVVMELCMLRLFEKVAPGSTAVHGRIKAVYIAPTRSLVQERVRDWTQRFGDCFGANVTELTGDIEEVKSSLDKADIVCATPEKFDAISRKRQDQGGLRLFGEIALVLIDEVHLLNENRGSVLEAGVVSRITAISKLISTSKAVRFVAVSATVPNAQDLADWLRVPEEGLMVYGEEVRPVKLRTIVKGYNETKNDYLFERRLNDFIYPVIAEHSKGRPSLVFCSTRKGTTETANRIIDQSLGYSAASTGNTFVRDDLHFQRLVDAAKRASNRQLQQCLIKGVAFHHAGMDSSDRSLVEATFLNQDILVLCTTGTLAMGVNLPAHLVVIKGTRHYCGSQDGDLDATGYKEYERSMCLQMIGRAGRPQFDTEGVAVIMTQRQEVCGDQKVQRYENLVAGCEELESQLGGCFAEYLNAEIVLGTIKSIPLAVEWLRSTFLYIRAMKNPLAYGLPMGFASKEQFDSAIREKLVLTNLGILQKNNMVGRNGDTLFPLECGRLMAYYYVRLNTMIQICGSPSHTSIPDLIQIIAKAEELENMRLRRSEKRILNDINTKKTNPKIKYQVLESGQSEKVKQRISTAEEKIFILINDALSDSPSDTIDVSLRQETMQILRVADTITGCMSRYYASIGRLAATANSRILSKCVKTRLWCDSALQAKQLPNIGKSLGDRLAKAGLGKLRELVSASPRSIEIATQKNFPFGTTLLQNLQKRMPPDIDLQIFVSERTNDGRLQIGIALVRSEEDTPCQSQFMSGCLLCGTIHDDKLLLNQSINLKTFQSPYMAYVYVHRDPTGTRPIEVVASVILDKLVGMDTVKKLVIPFDVQPISPVFQQKEHKQEQMNNEVCDLTIDPEVTQRISDSKKHSVTDDNPRDQEAPAAKGICPLRAQVPDQKRLQAQADPSPDKPSAYSTRENMEKVSLGCKFIVERSGQREQARRPLSSLPKRPAPIVRKQERQPQSWTSSGGPSQICDTIRHLRERNKRQEVDFCARARAIIQSRNNSTSQSQKRSLPVDSSQSSSKKPKPTLDAQEVTRFTDQDLHHTDSIFSFL